MRMGLFTMFARLAEPPAPGTGAWRVRTGDGQEGVVLMEGGRVCWANHSQGGRLTDEIEQRFGVEHGVIEQVVRRCRETKQPFGAALVEGGWITNAQLTLALREHTCRSILSLVRAGVYQCEWVPHQGEGYAPETTTSLAQTASACVAMIKGLSVEALEGALEVMLGGEAAGLLIHLGTRLPLAASASSVTWQDMRLWLTWALRIEHICALASRSYLAGRGADGGWVLWRSGGVLGLAVSSTEEVQRRVLLRVESSLESWTVEQPT